MINLRRFKAVDNYAVQCVSSRGTFVIRLLNERQNV